VPDSQTFQSAKESDIVDRITFNAHSLETATEFYRLRTSSTTARR
jgi:hypothetical protein